jgi:hypothetical protein
MQSGKEDAFLVGGAWSGGKKSGTKDTWKGMRSRDVTGKKAEDNVSV